MEGTIYLEHSVLGVSLDSGLMEGMSSAEPFEQSVLSTLLVARYTHGDGYARASGSGVASGLRTFGFGIVGAADIGC